MPAGVHGHVPLTIPVQVSATNTTERRRTPCGSFFFYKVLVHNFAPLKIVTTFLSCSIYHTPSLKDVALIDQKIYTPRRYRRHRRTYPHFCIGIASPRHPVRTHSSFPTPESRRLPHESESHRRYGFRSW